MARISFGELPDHGRLWIFPCSRALSGREAEIFIDTVHSFLDDWKAHGVPLRCAGELRDSRFLIVGVDVDSELPSGCSIDSLVNQLRTLGSDIGVSLVDHAPVWYREGTDIRSVSRSRFRVLAGAGTVTLATKVFDTSLTRIHDLRSGDLERPASDMWHGRAFFRDQVTA